MRWSHENMRLCCWCWDMHSWHSWSVSGVETAAENLIYIWKSLPSSTQGHFEIMSARLENQTASDEHLIQEKKTSLSLWETLALCLQMEVPELCRKDSSLNHRKRCLWTWQSHASSLLRQGWYFYHPGCRMHLKICSYHKNIWCNNISCQNLIYMYGESPLLYVKK